jgi:AcrR family transcriptional regulator
MTVAQAKSASPRKEELLEAAYRYAVGHGISAMSLRPLAAAIGTSPRVLLFLFGSKDELVRALLARARRDELTLVDRRHDRDAAQGDATVLGRQLWDWMRRPENRGVLQLWVDAYARSLVEPEGPWHGFAAATVRDWLRILTDAGLDRTTATAVLALLRGALLDLLATGDVSRTTRAVRAQLDLLG